MLLVASSGGSHQFSSADTGLVIAVVVLIALSAMFALSETALTRISRVKAYSLKEEGRRGAASLYRLVEQPERNLPVVLFLLEICTLVAATMVGVVADNVLGPWGVVAATGFEIIVIFVFAELAPKIWAVQHAERAALFMSPFLAALVSFAPLRWTVQALIRVANVVLPGKGIKEGPYVTEQELLAMADTAADEAVIEREERRLIHSIIDFGDTVAREVMVPRPDMVTVPVTGSVHDAADVASSEGFSRIPVYGNNIDDIVGIAYLKDLMRAEREGRAGVPVTEVMREAQFVPESKRIAEVMREMQAGKHHLAIVVDEYGGTAGLVTLEDVLEELVGEISDEYDVERPRIEHLPDGQLQVDGGLSIDEINEFAGLELPQGDWDTVGGLVYSLLGHVPEEGEAARYDTFCLVAQKVEGRRIAQVLIGPVPPDDGTNQEVPREAAGTAGGDGAAGAEGDRATAGNVDDNLGTATDGPGTGTGAGAGATGVPERPGLGQAAAGR
ncbi:MAG TPA: hemolysin family protein [Acidimicrobiales bacterium]|nr:hemolysin family protein [Acidimicrobiales bacterium]